MVSSMTDVVFFGDVVPVSRVEQAFDMVGKSDLLLCAGTSLMVFSGFRFVLAAQKQDIPIATVNYGSITRAQKQQIPHLKVEGQCGVVLPQVVQSLNNQ